MIYTDRAADMHKENMKKKRRDLEQASLDAASDLLDTDSNATFAMVLTSWYISLKPTQQLFGLLGVLDTAIKNPELGP